MCIRDSFDTEHREGTEGNGYAVYLWNIAPAALADSLGVAQGTSADIEACLLYTSASVYSRYTGSHPSLRSARNFHSRS